MNLAELPRIEVSPEVASTSSGRSMTKSKSASWITSNEIPDLVAFARQHTSLNTEGIAVVRLPPDTSDRTWFDVSVAHRKIVTDKGKETIATKSLTAGTDKAMGMLEPKPKEAMFVEGGGSKAK